MPDQVNDQPLVQPEKTGNMLGQAGTPDRRPSGGLTKNFSAILFLLARIILIVLIISVLAATYPVQPWSPLWYLKLGQIAVDYSATFLFVILLAFFSAYFASRWPGSNSPARKFAERLIAISLIIYTVLVPIQLLGFGLHWVQTGQQNKQAIRRAEQEVAKLSDRIRAASRSEELLAALGPGAEGLPALPSALLAEQKTRLIDALNGRMSQLAGRLKNERRQRFASLSVSTFKGVIGAGVIAFGLRSVKQMLGQK